ncbi:MAG: exosortase A [Sphingomonadales bacterium]|nr:exosortase A [Sphingomonadales bacterium]
MLPDVRLRPHFGLVIDLSDAWRRALVTLAIAWTGLIAAFSSDWTNIFGQWWNSSTYNHMLLVPIIVAWLVSQRTGEVLRLDPRPWWPGLAGVGGVLLVWVLGALSGFDLLRQTATVALLPATVLTLLGPKVFYALLFPMAYMAVMVPFGDEIIPPLQMITAALTIALVKLSGIPASIDGVFIDTPAGLFEVAEACSGVKFLIAMVALGVLVSHIGFKSWKRRAAFMLLCVVAPILANGVRAFGTVYAAQIVGAQRAGGIDHVVYGWFFFALVIAGVLALSWRFFDRGIDEPMIDATAIATSPWLTRAENVSRAFAPVALGLLAFTVSALFWARAADGLSARLPAAISLSEVPGWHRIDYAPAAPWEPRATGADHRLLGRYADGSGHKVDVFYALYDAQREGKEAGGYGEGALRPGSGWAWQGDGPAVTNARTDRLRFSNGVERVAVTYYRTGSLLSGSNSALKLATIRDRVLLRPRTTMLLILSAEERAEHPANDNILAFRNAIAPVGSWMDRTGSGR